MKVTVVGIGRLGAPYASSLAEIGHDVLGIEVDTQTLSALTAGTAPFDEPDLDEMIGKHSAAGTLRFSSSYDEAAEFADLHFVCVPTPQKAGGLSADLSYIEAAVLGLARRARRHCLIVAKSSVPVGTTDRLALAAQETARPGVSVTVAYSPDFLRESTSVEDAAQPTRIVVGVPRNRPDVEDMLRSVWGPWIGAGVPLVVTDLATAELAKSAANAFLATKISFINAMGAICERSGADVHGLAMTMGLDPRIGTSMLDAGLGFGGSCIPKDIRALLERGRELEVPETRFLREVDAINIRRQRRVVALAREAVGGTLTGRRVAVWGASFKPGTDDVRESPALAVAREIAAAGARVVVHDPKALPAVREEAPELETAESMVAVLDSADVLLHLTHWPEYRDPDPATLVNRIGTPHLVDARGTLDGHRWIRAGWAITGLGQGTVSGQCGAGRGSLGAVS